MISEALDQAEPGRALDALCGQFSSSLSFFAPTPLPVPKKWLRPRTEQAVEDMLRADMPRILEEEYYSLLFPNREVGDPNIDERLLKVAV